MPGELFSGPLGPIHLAVQEQLLAFGDDIVQEFTATQVSYGAARKFAWLTPLTKTKALLNLDLWEQRSAPILRSVIRYRDDKYTHQIEVRDAEDIDAIADLGWFDEAVSWGRKLR
ncbi:DUF5655 domain-containing protein [Microbacterium sp. CFBP9034]|uniref:DUF5655 domain-containing protein n=1 Tax=Microbacterium sp. CFBP9034 TaxID=3096540 RepID=UPI002A6B3F6F|nr:DUF5655 domain-containing protein [Microbacterium sp. CFBP9034]MDY0910932.1 DUF5655 domain-containing protein [Microbacterium sp. CFBP9034]